MTRIRERYGYGLSVFRRFFERIVEMCFEAGLVWGEELFFDATKVEANASLDSTRSRLLLENLENRLKEHLGEIFSERMSFAQDVHPTAIASVRWDPPARKDENWHRTTRASIAGSPNPVASSGR